MDGRIHNSNQILDKPGRLTPEEIAAMRMHPLYTRRVLERVASFRELAYVASLHHERPEGRGYPYGIGGDNLPRAARIIAAADFCDPLCAARPYRPASPWAGVCPVAFEALCAYMDARLSYPDSSRSVSQSSSGGAGRA